MAARCQVCGVEKYGAGQPYCPSCGNPYPTRGDTDSDIWDYMPSYEAKYRDKAHCGVCEEPFENDRTTCRWCGWPYEKSIRAAEQQEALEKKVGY